VRKPPAIFPRWAVASALRSARGSVIAGVLTGLFVFVPAAQVYRYRTDSAPLREGRDYLRAGEAVLDRDLQRLSSLEEDYRWLRGMSPTVALRKRLVQRLVAAADGQFAAYRTQAASPLIAFQWNGARACLQRAVLLSPSEDAIRGRLALAEGHKALVDESGDPDELHRTLSTAAALLPAWPDPHLALARFYIYIRKNLGLAAAEWHTAEKLGFQTGPREWEQEADGYLRRVEMTFSELRAATSRDEQRRLHSMLGRDAIRARHRYEPIAGFGGTSRSLDRLQRIEDAVAALEAQRAKPLVAKTRRYSRARQWR
jgi:hypothetical protein